MKIVIPMTGYGSRFVAAGYKELKPFIKVHDRPILEWVVKGMYPGETDFVFICRKEHLEQVKGMRTALREISTTARIIEIDNWIKKGPVYDVLRAADAIDDLEPVIINYCDYYQQWDYERFKMDVAERQCEGSIPCYTGFHPHLLIKKNVYASCLTDENDDLIEIREKYSFSIDKKQAKHSPGLYYFKTGEILKKYCQKLVENGPGINGEYYASLPYNYMVSDGLKVWIPTNVIRFCQWGTPEDLKDYLFWTHGIIKNYK